jgi:hypothetical protein
MFNNISLFVNLHCHDSENDSRTGMVYWQRYVEIRTGKNEGAEEK